MEASPAGDSGGPSGPSAGGPSSPFPNGLPVPPILFAGPILIGVLFTYLLYGVLLAQIVQYCQTVARRDRWAIKFLVATVVVVQTIHLGFITDNAWTVCVLGFLNPMNLISPPVSAPGTGILNGTVSLLVQMFFAWKISSLAAKNWGVLMVAGLVALLSVVQFGASIGISTKFIQINRQPTQMQKLKLPITIHLTTTAACDTVITLAMIIILSKYKENTSFARTKSLLNTLIISTVENGLITSVTAIANLVIFFTRTQDVINVAFQYVIGGLYAIVLITTLNRRQISKGTDGTSFSMSDAGNFSSSRGQPNFASGRGTAPSYQVNVLAGGDSLTAGTVDDSLGRAENGLETKGQRDIMVSVVREMHEDHPYAISRSREKF